MSEEDAVADPRPVRRLEARVAALEARVRVLEHVLAPVGAPYRSRRDPLDSGLNDAGPPRQASVTTGEWGARHDPRVMRVYGTDMFPAVLRSVEEEQARQAIERQRGSDVMWPLRAWCGKDGCRPASPCPSCAGHRTVVRDGTGAAPAVPRQTSAHPGSTFWDQFPDHQRAPEPGPPAPGSVWNEPAGAGAGFMTARQQALPPRPPSGDGDVLKGL